MADDAKKKIAAPVAVGVALDDELVVPVDAVGGARLDVGQVDLVDLEDVQDAGEDAVTVLRLGREHQPGVLLRVPALLDVLAAAELGLS